jgi:hypothetical protein
MYNVVPVDTTAVTVNRAVAALDNFKLAEFGARQCHRAAIEQLESIHRVPLYHRIMLYTRTQSFASSNLFGPTPSSSPYECTYHHEAITKPQYDILTDRFKNSYYQLAQLIGGNGDLRVGYQLMEFINKFENWRSSE